MKKSIIISFATFGLFIVSCNNNSSNTAPKTGGTVSSTGPDSAANNRVLPPSAAPDNATNSSLADTSYKAKDSLKSKK